MMSTHKIVTFMLIILIMIYHTWAQQDVYQLVQKRPSNAVNKYCGKNLANALHLLCNGVYNSMFKRDQEMNDYPFSYEDPYPFRSRAIANGMMGRFGGANKFRRVARGVHDECCAKPCSIEELASYCAVPL